MSQSVKVPADEPRGCFQVFAERKYVPGARGYENYRGAFHSLADAKAYALELFGDESYYTGYNWVQVADVVGGQVWDWNGGDDAGGGWGTQHFSEDGEAIEVFDND